MLSISNNLFPTRAVYSESMQGQGLKLAGSGLQVAGSGLQIAGSGLQVAGSGAKRKMGWPSGSPEENMAQALPHKGKPPKPPAHKLRAIMAGK